MRLPFHETGDDHEQVAFTLVELLVVMFVVALLAAFLLPAYARTTPNSAAFQCMNNNRQIGMAVHMYAADNRDYMPHPNLRTAGGDLYQGWLYTPDPTTKSPPDMETPPYNTNPELAYAGGLIWRYIRNIPSYWCPTDKSNNYDGLYWSWRLNKQSTYAWNGAVNAYGSLLNKTFKLSAFNPAAYLQWEPDEFNYYGGQTNKPAVNVNCYNDAAMEPSGGAGLGKRHGKKGGVLLGFSGNVNVITYEEFLRLRIKPGPNLLYCSPLTPDGRP